MSEPWLREELSRLRFRGHRGGFIPRHRALLFSPLDKTKVATAVLLVVGLLALWYWILDWVTAFWGLVMDFWASVLGAGGVVGTIHYKLFGFIPFTVPDFYVPSALPTTYEWWAGVLFLLVLVVVSLLLPRAYLPLSYFLRIVAMFQGCSQVFFAFWPQWFPYTASGYVHTVILASLALISLMPIVLGFTYYVFDFGLARNAALTLLVMGHLSVLVPLQYVIHAWVLYQGSLLLMPVLFLAAGLPVGVLVFIAFYSWGFSWAHTLREQHVQWKARKRFV